VLPAVVSYKLATGDVTNNKEQKYFYDPFYYVLPGIKYYPYGARHDISYSIAVQLLLGKGNENSIVKGEQITYDRLLFGNLFNNTLGINIAKHGYMALDFGLGVAFLNLYNNVNVGPYGFVQGGFKVGYRF
jgi:hypothetical protein